MFVDNKNNANNNNKKYLVIIKIVTISVYVCILDKWRITSLTPPRLPRHGPLAPDTPPAACDNSGRSTRTFQLQKW